MLRVEDDEAAGHLALLHFVERLSIWTSSMLRGSWTALRTAAFIGISPFFFPHLSYPTSGIGTLQGGLTSHLPTLGLTRPLPLVGGPGGGCHFRQSLSALAFVLSQDVAT